MNTEAITPGVSVIIPCYNLGQYLDEAVDSLLAQTYQDFEIIIINDGSNDEFTNTLLKDYAKPKCTVYTTPNQGLPAARNYGIERSSGEYICCLDADDKYYPEFLEKSVAVLDNDDKSELGFVTTWVSIFGNESGIWETEDYNPYKLIIENQIHVASLFRKRINNEVTGYSTNLSGYQDWDFWLKIVAQGYKWHVIKEPLFYYRKREDSMIGTSDSKRVELRKTILENNLDFIKENAVKIIQEYDMIIDKNLSVLKDTINSNNKLNERLIESQSALNTTKTILQDYYNLLQSSPYKLIKRFIKILFQKRNKQCQKNT